MGLWLWFKVTLLFVSESLLFGGSGLVMKRVCDCGLCVSDLGGLGLSGQRILIECHGLKGEELIKIRARWRRWFECGGLGVGR